MRSSQSIAAQPAQEYKLEDVFCVRFLAVYVFARFNARQSALARQKRNANVKRCGDSTEAWIGAKTKGLGTLDSISPEEFKGCVISILV